MELDFSANKYLYRKQYVIAPFYIERFESWNRLKINDRLYITFHPDISVSKVESESSSITVIGYILDPTNINYTDENILDHLLSKSSSVNDLVKLLDNYGGRWVIVYENGGNTFIINDAAGLRQVFYTYDENGDFWCSSHSKILSEELNIERSREFENLSDLPGFDANGEFWFPSGVSHYVNVKHLVPNHYLDVRQRKSCRYFPYESLAEIDFNDSVKLSSNLIKGLLLAASKRFKLALPITAGWDSRVLLAASKDIKDDIYFYTLKYSYMSPKDDDLIITNKLLSKLNLKQHILECPDRMSGDFKDIHAFHSVLINESWGSITQGLFNHYPQDRVCVKGNVSEIARNFFGTHSNENVDENLLAKFAGVKGRSVPTKHFKKWLEEIKDICIKYNYQVTDLFYWEQRMGSWQALSQLEGDIVQETFTPYNCRKLLNYMLGVNVKYRDFPDYKLYKKIIEEMWEETLSYPINPSKNNLKNKLKQYIKRALHA